MFRPVQQRVPSEDSANAAYSAHPPASAAAELANEAANASAGSHSAIDSAHPVQWQAQLVQKPQDAQ